MRASRFTWALVLSLLLDLSAHGMAEPISYDFRLIADTSGSFQALGPFVSINNEGTAAPLKLT